MQNRDMTGIGWANATAAAVLIGVAVFLAGCKTTRADPEPTMTAQEAARIAAWPPHVEPEPEVDEVEAADEPVDDERVPAQDVVEKPDEAVVDEPFERHPDEPRMVMREIKLYAELYKAAYMTNVGLITEHYLLDPPADPPKRWYPSGIELEHERMRARVLEELERLEAPFAWTPRDVADRPLTEPVHFPGTDRLATRLRVRILDRTEAGESGRPTVRARLTDATAHVGGTRQDVTAVWDGERWTITRDRAFHVW